MMILTFLASTIGKYLLIGALAFGALAWYSHDLKAPLKAEISALREAARQKEAIIRADAERADADRSEIARLEATVESIAHESRLAPDVCRLSDHERDRLQQLASGKR